MEHNKLRAPLSTDEVENNWAISYGDMITLLLGFFVIFFNIKTDTLNLALLKKDLDQFFDHSKKGEISSSYPNTENSQGQKTAPILTSDISNVLQIKSNIEGERILVEFPKVSFFDSGSYQLTQEGEKALSNFATALSGQLGFFRLVVRGYTDGKPVNANSRFKDNLELSAFRSISAIRHLATQGVKLDKMRIAGYGESSLSREDIKVEDSQRKIVIVIEPLDHTERVANDVKNSKFYSGNRAVEKVEEVHIDKREPSSVEVKSLISAIDISKLKQQMLEIVDIKEIRLQVNDFTYKIDNKIEESPIYQKFVNYLVQKDLERKGHSPSQAKEIIKNYDQERGLE